MTNGPTRRWGRSQRGRSDGADVLRLQALGALRDVELDLLVLGERLEAGAGDAAVVHEDVAVTAVLRDEAEALGLVEPLDGSGCHSLLLDVTAVETRRRWC